MYLFSSGKTSKSLESITAPRTGSAVLHPQIPPRGHPTSSLSVIVGSSSLAALLHHFWSEYKAFSFAPSAVMRGKIAL